MRKMRKFKVDDIVVIKNNNDMPLYKSESVYRIVDFYKSSIDDKYYYAIELAEPSSDYLGNNSLNQQYIEENYINMDEVYWYFEKKDEGGWIKYDDRRHTFKEIRETMAKNGLIENVHVIYALGFKLPY